MKLGLRWSVLRWVCFTVTIMAVAALVALLGVLVVSSVVNEHQAIKAARTSSDTATTIANNAKARITSLYDKITALNDRLNHTSSRASKQRGRMEAQIRALSHQVKQLGGVPVTAGTSRQTRTVVIKPTPGPTRTVTARPTLRPRPSPSHPCLLTMPICVPSSGPLF